MRELTNLEMSFVAGGSQKDPKDTPAWSSISSNGDGTYTFTGELDQDYEVFINGQDSGSLSSGQTVTITDTDNNHDGQPDNIVLEAQ